MNRILFAAFLLPLSTLSAEDTEGWISLYNGKDLSNWVNVNCAPETWTAGDGIIQCTGNPVGALRTPKQYENFIFECEWRHLKSGGNAGIFVWASPVAAPGVPFLRSIEVQVLDNGYNASGKNGWYTTHGDIFPIHGSAMKPIHKGNGDRCFPLEERSKSAPEWNHYRIVANDGKIRLSVNGKEVTGGDQCVWRKGYLGLESEGSPTEWRNLRLKELPSTGATAADAAPADLGWQTLYTGTDLRGWTQTKGKESGWKASGWNFRGPANPSPEDALTTVLPFAKFELLMDWRSADERPRQVTLRDEAGKSHVVVLNQFSQGKKATDWHRLTLASASITELKPGKWTLSMAGEFAPAEVANVYIREVK
jgi:hypothetical protein